MLKTPVHKAACEQITAYLLAALQQDPSLYLGLQDATLVQNVNAVDTLENTLQVLNPALQLLLQPEVRPPTNPGTHALSCLIAGQAFTYVCRHDCACSCRHGRTSRAAWPIR